MVLLRNNWEKPARLLSAILLALCLLGPPAHCESAFSLETGGHLRLRGSMSDPAAGSRLSLLNRDRLHDGAFEFRSKHAVRLKPAWQMELHYEIIGSAGETRQTNAFFADQYPAAGTFLTPDGTSDDRRLMDLTHVLTRHTDYMVCHRLDRLAVSARRNWGSVRVGRQALTWGNGFLFNPMDLFNPFSPTDVERDYKTGDDMAAIQAYTGATGEIQALYVPRRDPETENVELEESSAAAKYHTYIGSLEMDVMAGVHYDDVVAGIGWIGYVGSAAWRLDATYTWLDANSDRNGFASIAANLDYSWVWWGKNMYGWIECFYTGLGTSDYEDAWQNRDLMDRIDRGERFTLGRAYFDAQLQVEIHPLLNGHITLITNIRDPSGAVQPRLVWDPVQNLQATAGANLYYGGSNTEFGGFDLPMLPFKEAPADNVYLWVSYFY